MADLNKEATVNHKEDMVDNKVAMVVEVVMVNHKEEATEDLNREVMVVTVNSNHNRVDLHKEVDNNHNKEVMVNNRVATVNHKEDTAVVTANNRVVMANNRVATVNHNLSQTVEDINHSTRMEWQVHLAHQRLRIC